MEPDKKKEDVQRELYDLPYHWILRGYLRVSYGFRNSVIIDQLKRFNPETILDIGCGDGKFISDLHNSMPEARTIGVDSLERAIRFARIMTDSDNFVRMSGTLLAFKDDIFDTVTCLDVLEHIPAEDSTKLVDEIYRVMSPGGHCIVSVPSTKVKTHPMHYHHFTPGDILDLMGRKFDDVNLKGCCYYVPVLHILLTKYPLIWRILLPTIRLCNPDNCITLLYCGVKRG